MAPLFMREQKYLVRSTLRIILQYEPQLQALNSKKVLAFSNGLWLKRKSKWLQKVYWNGVTTLELAKAVETAIEQKISGLYHLTAPSKISKYELLHHFQNVFSKYDTEILPCDEFEIDRTLKCTRKDFTYNVPSYIEMLEELKGWISYRAN